MKKTSIMNIRIYNLKKKKKVWFGPSLRKVFNFPIKKQTKLI